MSDKELDKLFQDNFDSFEVQPSAGLWDKIDAELDAAPVKQEKKKVFPMFWMAAASVVVVMGAALYFMPQEPTVKLQGKPKQSQIAQNKPEVKTEEQPVEASEPTTSESESPVKIEKRQEPAKTKRILLAQNENPHTTVASSAPGADNSIKADVKVASLSALSAKNSTDNMNISSQPVSHVDATVSSRMLPTSASLVAANAKNDIDTAGQNVPRRKIKSIGDLVNRVIAKVDPRDEKIIQFSDNDEGTEVSGINLGLIKFKHNHNK